MFNLALHLCVLLVINQSNGQDIEVIGAFTAARVSDVNINNSAGQRIAFSKVITNTGGFFDEEVNVFDAKLMGGTWYTSVTAGISPTNPIVDLTVENLSPRIGYINVANSNHLINGNDLVSRGYFRNINATEVLNVMGAQNTTLTASPENLLTSWTMFRFEEMERTVVAFSAVRNTSMENFANPMSFDEMLINTMNEPFNTTSSTFTAPITGVYFCHISGGTMLEREMRMRITRFNPANVPATSVEAVLLSTESRTNGSSTISRSVLMNLDAGDDIFVVNDFGSALYSDEGWQTSFTCFGYSLEFNPRAASFFAALTTSWQGAITQAPIAPWQVVTVNQGNGFDPLTGFFIAPLAGTYFVSISAGVQVGQPVGISLYKAGTFVIRLERTSFSHNGVDTLSRDVTVVLAAGDQLHLESTAGTAYYSGPNDYLTSFLAFRVKNAGLG